MKRSDRPEGPALNTAGPALHPGEVRYRLLVECSPYCIHQIDSRGCLSAMNAAGRKMMEVDEELAIIGMPYLDAVAEPDRERVAELMQAAYQGTSSQFEFEAVNGRLFSSSFVPLFGDRKCVFGLMGLTQDVTEQRHAERALQESERRLELALQGADLGIWDWDICGNALVVSERLLAMVGYQPGEIQPLLEGMRDLIHPEDRERVEGQVNEHLAGRSPRIESEHRIRTSDGIWKRVLSRGMVVERDAGGKALRATGSIDRGDGGEWARLEVVDNGTGMTAEVQQRAFEPFFSTKQPQGGTGLGLAMVYGITQQNEGLVAIESQPRVGTSVRLEFPVTAASILPTEDASPDAAVPVGGTVLVVEDEQMVRDLVSQLLKNEGYEVLTAADGAIGVAEFGARDDIDLVLIDAIMPNMDGREAAAQMLRMNPNVKLLFTSGYHEHAVLPDEFLQTHGVQVLRKPYPVKELLVRVQEILEA